MDKDLQIMEEIIKITSEIETDYPELYKYLDETPISVGNITEEDISNSDLENYLNTLKWHLSNHIKSKENISSEKSEMAQPNV